MTQRIDKQTQFQSEHQAIQSMQILMDACMLLDERKQGFCFPDGGYENLTALLAASGILLGYLLRITENESALARRYYAAVMNLPDLQDEEFLRQLDQCEMIIEMTSQEIPVTFKALVDLDSEKMAELSDLQEYIPLSCLYVDVMEMAGEAALRLSDNPDLYESMVESRIQSYLEVLLSFAINHCPRLLETKPFHHTFDA